MRTRPVFPWTVTYIKKSDIENEYQSAGKEAQNDGINLNNEEENDCVQGFTDECSQTFLWIHQEKWQKIFW